MEEIKLKVGELTGREDFGRGIARLDTKLMRKIGVKEGDIIEIEGKKKTGAVAIRSYPADVGLNILRVDGLVRKNCDASIGETVTVRKADVKEAKKVVLAPAQKGFMLHISPNLLKQNLYMRPMTKGDIIISNPVFKTRRNHDDIFSIFGIDIEEVFMPMGTEMRLVVVNTEPSGITRITDMTEIELLPEAVEVAERKLPTVTYEDIGGLSQIIPKIREMIEVPLRHPEVFCVSSDTPILLKDGNTIAAEKLFNILSKKNPVKNDGYMEVIGSSNGSINAPQIQSINGNLKIVPCRIRGAVKLKADKIYHVLSNDFNVKVSENEPFLAMDTGGAISIKQAKELKVGDFVAAPLRIFDSANEKLRKHKIILSDKTSNLLKLENKIKNLRIIANSDIFFSRINEIKVERGNFDLYDFETDTGWFIGGNGLVLLHNTRLGVEAPKGVLLYGPPGTGKTLIAKAVANESGAHFISLAGPEIFCISTSTPIILNNAGIIKAGKLLDVDGRREINGNYEIIIPKENLKVFGVNNNFKISKNRIEKIIKVPVDEVYKVEFEREEPIEVSSNQPFLTIDDHGNIKWKRTTEIKTGDFVGFVTRLPTGSSQKIKWWEVLNDNIYIYEKNKRIPISDYKGSFKNVRVGFCKNPSNINRVKPIMLPTRTTKKLLEFLGYMFSEGSINDEEVSISIKNEKVRKRVKSLFKEIFDIEVNRIKEDKDRVKVYSYILAEYLRKVFNLPNRKKNKSLTLPPIIFKCSKDQVAEFLKSYFIGDGSIKIDKNGYPSFEYHSTSKNVLLGIKILLTFFGIRARLKKRKCVYTLQILDGDGRRRFHKEIIPNENIEYFNSKHMIKNSEWLPINSLIKKIKELENVRYRKNIKESSIEPYISGRRTLTKRKALEIISLLEKFVKSNEGKKLCKKVRKLISLPISWMRVKNIKSIRKKTILVDLEVRGISNFIATPNLLLLHNSKWYGQTEQNLRKVFEEADKNAPSIIFIDEIDAIAPKREEVTGEVERRTVSQLLTLMDGLKSRGKVIVIAATNRPHSLDPALRRTGRFDREIEIPVPDKKGRKEILQIHTRHMPLDKDVDLEKLAELTYGYVGADIAGLAKEAAMHALRRVIPEVSALKEGEPIPKEILEKLKVTKEDFDYALRIVQPSAMREVLVEIPRIKWEDVGDLEEVKQALKEAVEWPLKNPESFKKLGIRPPRGILLYGPPGCGKTYIVKALANEAGINFIAVKGPELISKWVGESERHVRDVFRRSRQVAPSIILFDEIDALAPRRGLEIGTRVTEQVVSQLLTEMSGISELEGVAVIATTNRPDILDPALLRPGRFDRLIYVPAPNEKARLEIFKIHTKNMPLKNVDLKKLAKETEGYSGADIESVCREAAIFALREAMKNKEEAKEILTRHFEQALKKVKPSITEDIFKKYQRAVENLRKTKIEEEERAKYRYIG